MRVKLTKIGNSYGVRLPKAVLSECGFGLEAELDVRQGHIILTPVFFPRADWEEKIEEDLQIHPVNEGSEWRW